MNANLFSNKTHTLQQEAEASAPRAEPQAEKRASVMGPGPASLAMMSWNWPTSMGGLQPQKETFLILFNETVVIFIFKFCVPWPVSFSIMVLVLQVSRILLCVKVKERVCVCGGNTVVCLYTGTRI